MLLEMDFYSGHPKGSWVQLMCSEISGQHLEEFMESTAQHYTMEGKKIEERYLQSAKQKLRTIELFADVNEPDFIRQLSAQLR
eukprot:SAG11_NODE_1590_length_4624_cov_3.572376_5_plen_83_part_00